MNRRARGALRIVFLAFGLAAAVLAAGYLTQQRWALATWPWVDGRLSNDFVASILAMIAVALFWVAASGQFAGTAGGFLFLGVMLCGGAQVVRAVDLGLGGGTPLHAAALGAWVAGIGCLVLAFWAHRLGLRDPRVMPPALRAIFATYVVILAGAGLALLRTAPPVLPWALKPATSLVYGWVFIGGLLAFLYPLLRPRVEYAVVGLWAFLAYDAVLIPPMLAHFATVSPPLRTNLVVYTVLMMVTAAISIWFLFIDRSTRIRSAGG